MESTNVSSSQNCFSPNSIFDRNDTYSNLEEPDEAEGEWSHKPYKGYGLQNIPGQNFTFVGLLPPSNRLIPKNKLKSLKQYCTTTLNSVFIHAGKEVEEGYRKYCKSNLWPLFHYVLGIDASQFSDNTGWESYRYVNELYAKEIETLYQKGDKSRFSLTTVWINDYHLSLLPGILRKRLPQAEIGFFLHSPFPSSEIFRCLPRIFFLFLERNEFLRGILGADMVSFQTFSYSRHFVSSVTRILGLETFNDGVEFEERPVRIIVLPIGADLDLVHETLSSETCQSKISAAKELFVNRKIIIGRDIGSQIKGVLHKLEAFKQLLERYPDTRGQVVFIQITSPDENTDKASESKVSDLISKINGTFGALDYTPVHYYNQFVEREEYFALLSVADAGIALCERGGIDSTSLDFIISQKERRSPLILSEFVGLSGSLCTALLVNPWNHAQVAAKIYEALNMTEFEKKHRHYSIYKLLSNTSVAQWASDFVSELEASKSEENSLTPRLQPDFVRSEYRKSKKRAILLDYDGTLTPIVQIPSKALPSTSLTNNLIRLTENKKNNVFIISGRDRDFLSQHFGHISGLGLSAEHGCFIRYPFSSEWIDMLDENELQWKEVVIPVFEYFCERTPGSFIESKRACLTWHYRLADPEFGYFLVYSRKWKARQCQNYLENLVCAKLPVEVLLGKKNIEVRPVSISKGKIVKRLMTGFEDADFAFCAGDDKTDEDMFRALNEYKNEHFLTCAVGPAKKKTYAKYHLNSCYDVQELLKSLSDE